MYKTCILVHLFAQCNTVHETNKKGLPIGSAA